mmetsp:Transcript_2365/g.6337  ORF Transcript_2365/g.6337 Transcript_2365/m.6337 type:complete len:279 (-) Transcript_2365:642-1478(-)
MSGLGRPTRSVRPLWKSSTIPALILTVTNLLCPTPGLASPALASNNRNDTARSLCAQQSISAYSPSRIAQHWSDLWKKCNEPRGKKSKCTTNRFFSRLFTAWAKDSTAQSTSSAAIAASCLSGSFVTEARVGSTHSKHRPNKDATGIAAAHCTTGVLLMRNERHNASQSRPPTWSRSIQLNKFCTDSAPGSIPRSRSADANPSSVSMTRVDGLQYRSNTRLTSCGSCALMKSSALFKAADLDSADAPRLVPIPSSTQAFRLSKAFESCCSTISSWVAS